MQLHNLKSKNMTSHKESVKFFIIWALGRGQDTQAHHNWTEKFCKTLVIFMQLTKLIAQEDFINISCHESFMLYFLIIIFSVLN